MLKALMNIKKKKNDISPAQKKGTFTNKIIQGVTV